MADYDTLIAKSKELAAAGRTDEARRVAEIAVRVRGETKPFMQTLKENILGDDDPTTQNLGEKVGTALNKAGEALTFGLVGDEASAAAAAAIPGGMGYQERLDYERGQEEILERENPGVALTADIGGAVAGAVTPLGAIGTLGRGAGLGARMAASTGAGAGMGGVYGFTEGEGLSDRLEGAESGAKLGAVVGAATPAIGSAVQRTADALTRGGAIRRAARNAPTTDQLKAQGRALYDQVDQAGVRVRPDAVRSKMGEIADAIRGEGLKFDSVASQMPASRAALGVADELAGTTQNSMPFSDLDVARRAVGNTAGSNLQNKADTRVATEALTSLDDFVANLSDADVDAGDLQTLQSALPKARDVWARMSRSQLLDDAMENAADYRTGEASGLRAQFQRIVKNDKLKRGFSDAEIKIMRRVVNGSLPEQIVNYMGSGLGMMGQMGLGAGVGGLPGAIAGMATGAASRKGSEAIVRKNAEIARAIIANGGMTNLPVASEANRQIAEALSRRTGAAVSQ